MSSSEPPLSNVVKSLTILMMKKTCDFGLNFLPKGVMIYFLSFRKGSANPLDSLYLLYRYPENYVILLTKTTYDLVKNTWKKMIY